MYATHLHLILTHFPIVGIVIGIGILIYGLLKKNDDIIKIALAIYIIMGVIIIPVYFTGEWSKLIVEKLPGISDKFIKSHEEHAIKATFLMTLLVLMSIVNLVVIKKKPTIAKIITYVTLLVSIITFISFINVGNLGGKIRHSEIIEHNSTNDNN